MKFSASVIQGSGRGKRLGVPTLNLNLSEIPKELKEGIYACRVHYSLLTIRPRAHGREATHYSLSAVMHYGPRPVFHDSLSCEVHILDATYSPLPPEALRAKGGPLSLTVEVVQHLRDVQDFPSPKALKEQMEKDIAHAREILRTSPLPSGEG